MEQLTIQAAIETALDGNALLFVGAGFSRRCLNSLRIRTVEPVFANIQNNVMRRYTLRVPKNRWGRANGWALLAMTELLEVLPEKHPGRPAILELYRAHVRGLAELQGKDGRWHQLLDRPDSYLETSATAIYSFCIARGVNRGWLDALAHGPMAVLAWHAVTTQVNEQGQVENVCVGTGMGFDPAFYYARPVSPVAPHGYGPVLLAGAEMLMLAKGGKAVINDEAVMFGRATGM